MTPADAALARRAVACRRWRWMPGMRGFDAVGVAFRFLESHPKSGALVRDERVYTQTLPVSEEMVALALPDLSDPASLGCLLALVREAWGDETIHARRERLPPESKGRAWRVWLPGNPIGYGPTEAEALVAALEAAPAASEPSP